MGFLYLKNNSYDDDYDNDNDTNEHYICLLLLLGTWVVGK